MILYTLDNFSRFRGGTGSDLTGFAVRVILRTCSPGALCHKKKLHSQISCTVWDGSGFSPNLCPEQEEIAAAEEALSALNETIKGAEEEDEKGREGPRTYNSTIIDSACDAVEAAVQVLVWSSGCLMKGSKNQLSNVSVRIRF